MSIEIDFRGEVIKLIRTHQEELASYDKEAIDRRQRLGYRHFRRLESMGDDVGYVAKALVMRRQYLQIQRYKVRVEKKRMELLSRQAIELKELKSQWARAKLS
jgi:hypothetical protein